MKRLLQSAFGLDEKCFFLLLLFSCIFYQLFSVFYFKMYHKTRLAGFSSFWWLLLMVVANVLFFLLHQNNVTLGCWNHMNIKSHDPSQFYADIHFNCQSFSGCGAIELQVIEMQLILKNLKVGLQFDVISIMKYWY